MSILIKDMEMPKEGTVMAIYKLDGRFYASVHGTELCPLIEIPEHDCVDLAEKVTATFYSEEYEEWTQQTVTIADILDSVCDDYTILPSAQRKGKWINKNGIINCSVCRHSSWSMSFGHLVKSFNFCPNCGADMRGEEDA